MKTDDGRMFHVEHYTLFSLSPAITHPEPVAHSMLAQNAHPIHPSIFPFSNNGRVGRMQAGRVVGPLPERNGL
jgi:hypothetical protein